MMSKTPIQLVDAGWGSVLTAAIQTDPSKVCIICPFIKVGPIERLLSYQPSDIQVITRFNLADFAEGVSDVEALRKLLDADATIRGIQNLHAKLYLFGTSRAVITSANLTEAALTRNQEFGVVAYDATVILACQDYFNKLWRLGGSNLSRDELDVWTKTITRYHETGGRSSRKADLGDFGVDAGFAAKPPSFFPAVVADAKKAFVKFLGKGNNRIPVSEDTINVINSAGCHWAVAYPSGRRPISVEDGTVMFIACLTDEPDIRIFGRSIGMKHQPERDDATPEDIALRDWKKDWPHYIRVHHAEFVAGTIVNGVSLYELMDILGSDSFVSTQRNSVKGEGNTNPRRAYGRQAAVELSPEGFSWLSERLQGAFDEHGQIPRGMVDQLDWPLHLQTS